MSPLLPALVLSTLTGALIARWMRVYALVASLPAVAVLSAIAFHSTGFEASAGIAATLLCMVMQQVAYIAASIHQLSPAISSVPR